MRFDLFSRTMMVPLSLAFAAAMFVAACGLARAEAADDADGSPATVAVPELRGVSLDEAGQKASLAGLGVASGVLYLSEANWRNTIRPDTVCMQTPQPGRRLPRNAAVAVWTFAKAERDQSIVKVPDFRRLAVGAARERVQGARLKLAESATEADASIAVVDQYPSAGQTVYEGTSVYLVVGAR